MSNKRLISGLIWNSLVICLYVCPHIFLHKFILFSTFLGVLAYFNEGLVPFLQHFYTRFFNPLEESGDESVKLSVDIAKALLVND